MPHPCPHHRPPEGGGGLAAAAGVLFLIGAAIARPVIHAAEIALEIVIITAGCLAVAGLVTVAAVLALRLRRTRALPRGGP